MIRYKCYKKTHDLRKYLSCHSTLGRYIHRIYCIETNLLLSSIQGILQILQVVPLSSTSSLLSSLDDLAKLLHCHDGHDCCPSWGISSFIDNRTWWYLLSSSSPLPSPSIFSGYKCLVYWDICAFLRNCSREFSQFYW